jgi:hypothetical protein
VSNKVLWDLVWQVTTAIPKEPQISERREQLDKTLTTLTINFSIFIMIRKINFDETGFLNNFGSSGDYYRATEQT